MVMKFVTLNVAGINNIIKRRRIVHYLRTENFAVVCLKETHILKDDEQWLKEMFNGQTFHSEATSRVQGVFVGLAKFVRWESIIDPEGCWVIVYGAMEYTEDRI